MEGQTTDQVVTTTATTEPTQAANQATAQATTEQRAPEAAKYTDSQVNDLIAKNTAKEVGKMLKDAGLEASGNVKQDLAAFKAWKESQMSESEKANARAKELETANAEAIARADRAEAKAEALARGVPADKADKVVKLATSGVYEGENVAAKIEAVLAEFPDYIAKNGPVFGMQTRTEGASAQDTAMQAALKAAGLAK
jgi:hypothetical protein